MAEVYKYDAFISYRHVDPDQAVAKELHRQLESYKLPKNVDAMLDNGHTKIERVFRDDEELPIASNLENSIVTALENSEWLIVVCSPSLPASEWCRLEIKTFIELHGRDHVLAVLIDGEPEDSFPPELCYEDVSYIDADGVTHNEKKYIEPLAADIRGKNKKEILKNISKQKLRLIAAMFRLNYDDLKQRNREKKIRHRLIVMSIATVITTIIGFASLVALLLINNQKNKIEQQSLEIQAQAEEIEIQNQALLSSEATNYADISLNYLENNDRYNALLTAYNALTEIDEIEMPYTPQAEYALTSSLYVYSSEGARAPFERFEVPGNIEYMLLSNDGNILAVQDDSDCLTIWATNTMQLLGTYESVTPSTAEKRTILFIDDSHLVFIKDSENYSLDNSNGYGSTFVFDCQTLIATKLSRPDPTSDDCMYSSDVCVIPNNDTSTFYILTNNNEILVYDNTTYDCVHYLSNEDLLASSVLNDPWNNDTDVTNDIDTDDADEETTGDENSDDISEEPEDTSEDDTAMFSSNFDAFSSIISNVFYVNNKIVLNVRLTSSDFNFIRVIDATTYDILYTIETDCTIITKAYADGNTLYYSGYDGSSFIDSTSHITSIDTTTNSINWEYSNSRIYIKSYYHTMGNYDYIYGVTYNSLDIIDASTGEVISTFSNGCSIISIYSIEDILYILTENNDYYFMIQNDDGSFGDSYGLSLTTNVNDMFSAINWNYIRQEVYAAIEGRNYFTVFRPVNCPSMTPLTSSYDAVGVAEYAEGGNYLSPPNCVLYDFSDSWYQEDQSTLNTFSERYNIDNISTISSIVEVNDNSYAIVNRSNHTFEIYTEDGTILGTYSFPNNSPATYFLGTDNDGNIYIADHNCFYGLKINPDGELLASINSLCGLDASNNVIVRTSDGTCMVQPIFTIDELLDMAENILESED